MTPRNLGRSGIKVSPICLGTMMFGGPTTEKDSARIIARAREAGVNFIDTADVYTEGRSEEITGRAIKADRSHWVLATKLANPTGPGPNDRGLSRLYTMRAVEASLKRLGTDVIDIYYLHKEDHATPLEETVRAMGETSSARARSAPTASPIIAPGASPRSATSPTAWASIGRSSASPITTP